jgi:hypothetical protein
VSALTPEQIIQAKTAGYEPGPDGYMVGRDPRQMNRAELKAMGHAPVSPVEAIRAKCLDCAGSSDEVRKCVAWPFHTGKNPWREVSEARREIGRRFAATLHRKSSAAKQDLGENGEPLPWGVWVAPAVSARADRHGALRD